MDCPICNAKDSMVFRTCAIPAFKINKNGTVGDVILNEAFGIDCINETASIDEINVTFQCKECGTEFYALPKYHNGKIHWTIGDEIDRRWMKRQ